jgi:hypothetical protein
MEAYQLEERKRARKVARQQKRDVLKVKTIVKTAKIFAESGKSSEGVLIQ